jgi:FtsP/CotA-like multicopper oxidase with cupredoxin domain
LNAGTGGLSTGRHQAIPIGAFHDRRRISSEPSQSPGERRCSRCVRPGWRLPRPSAQDRATSIDHTITIGPVSLELAPGKIVKTTGYNGTVPGPVLRLREGKPVAINVINDAECTPGNR